MHFGRIITIFGSVLAIVGLLLKSAISAGEEFLPAMNAMNPAFPTGFDMSFLALWNENPAAAAILAVALVAALGLSLLPNIKEAMSRMNALVVTVLGVLLLVIGGIAIQGAFDDARMLTAGFAEAFAGGAIGEAFTVSAGWGWYLLIFGGVLIAIGGVLQLIARPDESALSE